MTQNIRGNRQGIGEKAKLADFSPIDFESELNQEQFEAVTAASGPALVLAGAGSGKTRTLTYRVAWLLTQGVNPSNILLLTFTNKAAKEMLRRVEELTGVSAHRFWGGTFHHIGHKTVRTHSKTVGLDPSFTILDDKDSDSFLKDTIREMDPGFLKEKNNPKIRLVATIISFARNTRSSIEQVIYDRYYFFEPLVDRIQAFLDRYQKRKREHQVADFDDLIVFWHDILRKSPEVACHYRNQFKHILVDEYQDTNQLQADIVDILGKHRNLMAVGDDAQCIYTWRGASYENIMTFTERYPESNIYKIETNYRSTPQILNLANSILATQPSGSGYRKEMRPTRKSNHLPFVVPIMDSKLEAEFIIKRTQGLLDNGYRLSDIAILYRAHYQALDVQVELSRAGIPFIITSGVRFFEQSHVRDLVSQLRFTINPMDQPAFVRLTSLIPKVGERTALRLFEALNQFGTKAKISRLEAMFAPEIQKIIPKTAKEEWLDLAQSIKDISEAARNQTPADAVRIAIEGWYSGYIRTVYPNWQTRLEDLNGLIGFAGRFDSMTELLAQLILLNTETSDRSADNSGDFMRLTTVHQAKGLEFPIVFVIALADGLFPIRRSIEEGNLDEERRLFYVAVTRAKDELYLSYPLISPQGGPPLRPRPSRFVETLSSNHFEFLHPHRQNTY